MTGRWRQVGLGLAAVALLGAASGCRADAAVPQAHVWVTTADQGLLLAKQPDVRFKRASAGKPLTVSVDAAQQFQTMDGFGASFTDSAAWLFQNRLSPAQRAEAMTRLFDASAGIGLSYLRQPVGANDFSLTNYTYDDVPAGQRDPALTQFSIQHDLSYIVPALRQALALNPDLKVMASPWTAPAWMKSGGALIGGTLSATAVDAYAAYLVRFLQAYAAQGIRVDALTLQNEPDFSPVGYPGMFLTVAQEADLARRLGPMLAAADLDTKLIGFDGNWDNAAFATALLADAGASQYVAGVAFHCYRGDPRAQGAVTSAFPGKDVYVTECSGGAWSTSFGPNLAWDVRNLIIGATRNGARSVVKWNLALDQGSGPTNGGCPDCRGVVTVDAATGRVTYNVEYYSLGHASKFVRPGAHRVASTTFGTGSVETVAFRNPDGSTALVVLNGAGEPRSFTVQADGRAFGYSLAAGAVATFTW